MSNQMRAEAWEISVMILCLREHWLSLTGKDTWVFDFEGITHVVHINVSSSKQASIAFRTAITIHHGASSHHLFMVPFSLAERPPIISKRDHNKKHSAVRASLCCTSGEVPNLDILVKRLIDHILQAIFVVQRERLTPEWRSLQDGARMRYLSLDLKSWATR